MSQRLSAISCQTEAWAFTGRWISTQRSQSPRRTYYDSAPSAFSALNGLHGYGVAILSIRHSKGEAYAGR